MLKYLITHPYTTLGEALVIIISVVNTLRGWGMVL